LRRALLCGIAQDDFNLQARYAAWTKAKKDADKSEYAFSKKLGKAK
jgi:hypothetical protein